MEQHLVPETETEQMIPLHFNEGMVGVNSAWKKRPTCRGESCPTRQIPREELVKLLPESWVTNYEKLHESSVLIKSVDSSIYKRKDGAIEISFKQQDGEKSRHPAFCAEINAISPAEEVQPLKQYLPGVPINKFNAAGDPIYALSDETGHKFFDVCDCDYCLMSSSDEEEKPSRRKKKSSQQILKERYESGDPETLMENQKSEPMTQTQPLSFSHDPSIFGSSSFLPTRIKEQRPAKKKHPTVPKETPKISAPENTKTTSPEKGEAQFMVEHAKNPISTSLEQVAEQTKPPKQQRSAKSLMTLQESSDEEFIIPNFMMAEPTVEEEDMESDGGNISEDRREPQRPQTPPDWNPRSHTDSHSGFSFDNVPPSKWRDKIYEMHAWLTEQLLNPGATLPTVIDKIISKFHGRLRQWWISLGDYRQLQIRQSQSVDTVIGHIHNEFLGTWDHYTIQAREEYMSMRCCSFKRKDLEKHYERMSKRFYVLNGIDDVNLKQAYLNSLPEPLRNETS
ncbi:uncharacterized protein LOC112088468 [Eutrema salsugineum]|uniref:uncharacterized protein LOC112088468 n=1 Tax=Eutrema salsugineum TaxID=72664 RepID=UPI000CED470A|nr:uncharacterized protein LOC112088468 [Eutrema salsugineum]